MNEVLEKIQNMNLDINSESAVEIARLWAEVETMGIMHKSMSWFAFLLAVSIFGGIFFYAAGKAMVEG